MVCYHTDPSREHSLIPLKISRLYTTFEISHFHVCGFVRSLPHTDTVKKENANTMIRNSKQVLLPLLILLLFCLKETLSCSRVDIHQPSLGRFAWFAHPGIHERRRRRRPQIVERLTTTLRGGGVSNDKNGEPQHIAGFSIQSDTVIHDNWRKLSNRKVQLPNGHVADFEIVSQGDRGGRVTDQAVVVFVWHSKNRTATMIREYMPSVHHFMYGLAAGMVEEKHGNDSCENADIDNSDNDDNSVYTAAVHELEEECRLTGGTWYRLCQPTTMDKYCTTRLSVYLVIDPTPVVDPNAWKSRDETEQGMEIVHGITEFDLEQMIASGELTIVAGWASQLALRKLRSLGEIE